MFDLGWAKLVIIGVVALVVIGPEKLPEVLRTIGDALTKIRRMAAEFQGQFQDAMREANLDGIQREVQDLRNTMAGLNPLNQIQSTLEETKQSFESSLNPDKKPDEDKPVELSPGADVAAAKPAETPSAAAAPKQSGGGGGSLADALPPPPPPAPLDLTGAFADPSPAATETVAVTDDALPQRPRRRRKSSDETKSAGEDVGA